MHDDLYNFCYFYLNNTTTNFIASSLGLNWSNLLIEITVSLPLRHCAKGERIDLVEVKSLVCAITTVFHPCRAHQSIPSTRKAFCGTNNSPSLSSLWSSLVVDWKVDANADSGLLLTDYSFQPIPLYEHRSFSTTSIQWVSKHFSFGESIQPGWNSEATSIRTSDTFLDYQHAQIHRIISVSSCWYEYPIFHKWSHADHKISKAEYERQWPLD